MKKIIFWEIMLALFLLSQCSTDKNPLPSTSHPEGWNVENAENFHGTKVLEIGYTSCETCHGADLQGGKSGKSCHECHQTYPHQESWVQYDNDANHGAYVENSDPTAEDCKKCHGADLSGGKSGISCFDCHAADSVPN